VFWAVLQLNELNLDCFYADVGRQMSVAEQRWSSFRACDVQNMPHHPPTLPHIVRSKKVCRAGLPNLHLSLLNISRVKQAYVAVYAYERP
jgi:hypothetical protein